MTTTVETATYIGQCRTCRAVAVVDLPVLRPKTEIPDERIDEANERFTHGEFTERMAWLRQFEVVVEVPRTDSDIVTCGCGKVAGVRRVEARLTGTKCDARCTTAKGWKCECSCDGKNHGADHR